MDDRGRQLRAPKPEAAEAGAPRGEGGRRVGVAAVSAEIETGPEARRRSEGSPRLASRSKARAVSVIEEGEELDHCIIGQVRPVDELAGTAIVAVSAAGAAGEVIVGGLGQALGHDDLLLAFGLGAPSANSPAHGTGNQNPSLKT